MRIPIVIPDRELIEDELEMLEHLRHVYHEGRVIAKWNSFSPTIAVSSASIPELKMQLEPFKDGKTSDLTLFLEETVNLFDVNLPIGKIKPIQVKAKLANEQEIQKKLANPETSEIQLQFIPDGDSTIMKEYLDWLVDLNEVNS